MKRNIAVMMAALTLSVTLTWAGAFGQRGTGEQKGIAQQTDKPEVVAIEGKVVEVKVEPCKETTGRTTKGTHVTLLTAAGKKVNIHLGPETRVKKVSKRLKVDQEATVKAFRTDRLPDDAYIAKSVRVDDKTIRLRDDNLRPVWAGGSAKQKGQGRGRWSAGNGPGLGPGCCAACPARAGQGPGVAACGAGNGRGCCAAGGRGVGRGPGMGQGRGAGRGPAAGRGPGAGRGLGTGRGPGMGRGPAASTGS